MKDFKIFYGAQTLIFLSSAWRMQFLGVYKWCSANVCWRIGKMSEVIGCVTEVYFLLQC